MKIKTKLIVLSAFMALFWLLPVHAQENDGIATIVLITPKDGHEKTLVKAITDYHHWVANFEGHFEYNWYEILTGPNTGKYLARSGNHNWADFDAEHDWDKEAGEVFAKNVAPHVKSMSNTITEEMADFAHWPESFEGYTHFQLQDWHVKNGQYGAFRRGLKEIVDTLKAGDFPNHFGFFSLVSGGPANQITLVTPHKGWAGMADKEPSFFEIMSKSLGGQEEFDAFMADWGSTYKTGGSYTIVRMPEASDYGN